MITKERPEEPGHAPVGLVAGAQVGRLHDRGQWSQADGQVDEDEVVKSGRPELQSGQDQRVHQRVRIRTAYREAAIAMRLDVIRSRGAGSLEAGA